MQTDHPNNQQLLLGPEQYSKSKKEWKFRQLSQIIKINSQQNYFWL